jgi:hypothetical protein
VIVLHPGSRFLRIGKASDVSPITVLNVVARKCTPPVPSSDQVERISRPRKGRRPTSEAEVEKNDDESEISLKSDDPVRFICCYYVLLSLIYGHSSMLNLPQLRFLCEIECDFTNSASLLTLQELHRPSMNNLNQR